MKKLKGALKTILLICVFVFIGNYIFKEWGNIAETLFSLNLFYILLSFFGLLVYQFLNASVWKKVLESIGEKTPLVKTTCLWLQTESLKWIPGGIWGYGSRIIEAKQLGVSKAKASASLVVELILTILAWGSVASILFFTPFRDALLEKAATFLAQLPTALLIFIILGVIFVGVLGMILVRKKLHHLQKISFTPKSALTALIAYITLCLFNGLLLWVLCLSTDEIQLPLTTAIGASGLAWLIGFFAVGIPGGIGVREGAIVWAVVMTLQQPELVPAMSAIAIVWRLLQVLAELTSLSVASLTLYKLKSQNANISLESTK